MESRGGPPPRGGGPRQSIEPGLRASVSSMQVILLPMSVNGGVQYSRPAERVSVLLRRSAELVAKPQDESR